MKLVPKIALATARSKSARNSIRQLIGIVMLISALAFSGCAMNDQYSPIAGPQNGFSGGFGGGGG